MSRNLYNVVGLDDLKKELSSNGINLSEVDVSIANAIFELTGECVKRGYEDKDGIIIKPVKGFIYNAQVASLLKSFPNAVTLLSKLDSKNNYGFVEDNGEIRRTGMMGDIDPIMEAKAMVEAYIGNDNQKKKLFSSEKAYDEFQRKENDRELNMGYGQSNEEYSYSMNYNENEPIRR